MSAAPTTSTSDLGAERRARLAAARLYLVCDSLPGDRRSLADFLPRAIAGGVEVVQLREKGFNWHGDPDDRRFLREATGHAAELCKEHGALFVVNDYPEVAVEIGADGVHVGQDDTPVAEVRAIVGPDMLVGLSTHAPGEIDAAAPTTPDGAPAVDYIGVGPVHATPTKPGRPAVGLELVRYAAARLGGDAPASDAGVPDDTSADSSANADAAQTPFFVIGGIDLNNVDEVLAAGASRVCVLRAIADAEDPERAARALRDRLDAYHPLRCPSPRLPEA